MRNTPSDEDDLETVARWMRQLEAEALDGRPLADPSILWWKAQLLRRWDAEHQAAAPIEIGERIDVGIGALGGLAALVWLRPELSASVHGTLLIGVVALTGLLLVALAALSAWGVLDRE